MTQRNLSIPEIRGEVARLRGEAMSRAYCLEQGWPTLCRRFRAALNEVPRPEDPAKYERWTKARVDRAHEFFAAEGIPKPQAGALVDHVPVTASRGYRKCLRCGVTR